MFGGFDTVYSQFSMPRGSGTSLHCTKQGQDGVTRDWTSDIHYQMSMMMDVVVTTRYIFVGPPEY